MKLDIRQFHFIIQVHQSHETRSLTKVSIQKWNCVLHFHNSIGQNTKNLRHSTTKIFQQLDYNSKAFISSLRDNLSQRFIIFGACSKIINSSTKFKHNFKYNETETQNKWLNCILIGIKPKSSNVISYQTIAVVEQIAQLCL